MSVIGALEVGLLQPTICMAPASQGIRNHERGPLVSGKDPPGLIQSVLTVLVSWFRVLLMPGSRALSRSFVCPRTSICSIAPFEQILGSAAPSSPATRTKMGRTAQDTDSFGQKQIRPRCSRNLWRHAYYRPLFFFLLALSTRRLPEHISQELQFHVV